LKDFEPESERKFVLNNNVQVNTQKFSEEKYGDKEEVKLIFALFNSYP
jgi:hypothetical protein